MLSERKILNRLANEKSPYLLQHAQNPVDWYPWGDEAFEKARAEDKPMFLSIGYSTCHWCHVMAHESFENQEVADILKASFVSVKVDREERPDIDEVYMKVCQQMTGSGGWPLTIIMTADKKPFFAGTYLPKSAAFGMMGLTGLLIKVAELWRQNRGELIKNSENIADFFKETERKIENKVDEAKLLKTAYQQIKSSFDEAYGGFSQSPKFPMPHYLLFLLNYWKAQKSTEALGMVEKTLGCMYRGGIFDHVGYGFSRYSTDRKWLVPHFEKMLYDNALMLLVYTECFAAACGPLYRSIAQKTAEYLLRDMRSPDGAFYSAQDADSEGVEGKYYVWDYGELKELLSSGEMDYIKARFGVTEKGNFEGKNILNLIDTQTDESDMESAVIKKLYCARMKRVEPFKDTKISASWNGLIIEALARAGIVFGDKGYIDSARGAADFIMAEMVDQRGALSGSYKDGIKSSKGFLADYANMGCALLELYTATLEIRYLKKAADLASDMIRFFWDVADKRFYMCRKGEEELFLRPGDEYDGAMPSGNSSAVMLLSRLNSLKGGGEIKNALSNAVQGFLPIATESPASHVHFLSSVLSGTVPHRQVVIAAERGDKDALAAYNLIISRFDPFTAVIYYDKRDGMDELPPELIQYKTGSKFAGYVCENFACKKPVYNIDELLTELDIKRVI